MRWVRSPISSLAIVALAGVLFALRGTPAEAQTLGIVTDDTPDAANVFDADTLQIVGTIPIAATSCCDVSILPNQTKGFVTRFVLNTANVVVIDLTTTPPMLAGPPNPINAPSQPLDSALTADGRFLLVSDGSAAASPIAVIDTATQLPVSQLSPDTDRNSIEVCDDNTTVLMTSIGGDNVRKLALDSNGQLTDTGQVFNLPGADFNSVECAPGSQSGAAVSRGAAAPGSGSLFGFRITPGGLIPTNSVLTPGTGIGINVLFNPAGTMVYGRRGTSGTTAYMFDSATGIIGAQVWTAASAARPTYFGADQMAIHPDGTRIYISGFTANNVGVLDANTGVQVGTMPVNNPTGINFRAGPFTPPPPPPVGVDPNQQLGCQVHLPILNFQNNDDVCSSWIEVQYIGGGEQDPDTGECEDFGSKAVLITWGEPGFCPPQAAGPLKVECTGLLVPGASWLMSGAQIPTGSKSGILFKFTAKQLLEVGIDLGFDDVVADLMCEELFFGVVGDADDYRRFKKAYNEGGTFRSIPQRIAMGTGILAVEVLRRCPGDVTPGVDVTSKYNGIAGTHLGQYDEVFGGFGYYVPLIYADKAGLNTVLYIQNGGLECSSIEIWFKAQDDCLRARICDVTTLAPGETYQFDATDCVGPDWQGSAWVRSSEPMGIAVDIYGRDVLMTYVAEPAPYDYVMLNEDGIPVGDAFRPGNQVAFGPLIYSEYQGWDTGVQVQNMSPVYNAKVKVYFLDRSGDVITTLVDWICPRGSQTFFLPIVANLPGNWVGSIRVESQDWWTPGTKEVLAPDIVGVATLMKYSDATRTNTTEALAYELLPEHKAYIWQVGSGEGGLFSGVGLIAIPSLLKDLDDEGITSELAIMNIAEKPGFTDFAIYIYDQNGLLDFVCEKLHDRQVEYIDLQTWGYVGRGFKGSAIISATFWEHDVFNSIGEFVRNVVGLGAVNVERTNTRLGEDIPGDEAAGARGIPFAQTDDLEHCFMGTVPFCPGQPTFPTPVPPTP